MLQSQVAIARAIPIVAAGIRAALEATDFEVVAVAQDRLSEWMAGGGMVIVEVRTEDDLRLLTELRNAAPEGCIVAVVAASLNGFAAESLRAGATSSIPLGNDIDSIALALRAAQARLAVVPESVRWTLAKSAVAEVGPKLEPGQIQWLEQLAAGQTIGEIADASGYSQRAMHRLLSETYERLGAEGRISALVQAARLGII